MVSWGLHIIHNVMKLKPYQSMVGYDVTMYDSMGYDVILCDAMGYDVIVCESIVGYDAIMCWSMIANGNKFKFEEAKDILCFLASDW